MVGYTPYLMRQRLSWGRLGKAGMFPKKVYAREQLPMELKNFVARGSSRLTGLSGFFYIYW